MIESSNLPALSHTRAVNGDTVALNSKADKHTLALLCGIKKWMGGSGTYTEHINSTTSRTIEQFFPAAAGSGWIEATDVIQGAMVLRIEMSYKQAFNVICQVNAMQKIPTRSAQKVCVCVLSPVILFTNFTGRL
jgi:hypothetical protein